MTAIDSRRPRNLEPCRSRLCGRFVSPGYDAVPAWKITGKKTSRGWYCEACSLRLGARKP